MTYEELLKEADSMGLIVKEKPLQSGDGRIFNNKIAIRKDIPTQAEKACVLAEELGHHFTTYGNNLDQSSVANQKQEYRARLYGYNLKIGLSGIIRAYEHGCRTLYEMAEHLDVTEEYLQSAIDCYRSRYGRFASVDNYILYFIPCLAVMRIG